MMVMVTRQMSLSGLKIRSLLDCSIRLCSPSNKLIGGMSVDGRRKRRSADATTLLDHRQIENNVFFLNGWMHALHISIT